MMNLKNSVSVASICTALSLAAPAQAAIVSYDATISYTLDFSAGSGDLLFRLSYDDQAADTDPLAGEGQFPVLSFEITDQTGALGFGSTSSAAGDVGTIIQFSGGLEFLIDTASDDELLRLGVNFGEISIANPDALIQFDLNNLGFGEAYSGFTGSSEVAFAPTQVVTNVPLPSSLALMGLVVGGAAMRSAAKARRAAKRAGAGSRKAQA
ncbi:MAG: hypothetical protein AAGH74_02370 [Pseudomonadota bacterium]